MDNKGYLLCKVIEHFGKCIVIFVSFGIIEPNFSKTGGSIFDSVGKQKVASVIIPALISTSHTRLIRVDVFRAS